MTVENRWSTFAHGVAFVLGFSVVFITIGVLAGILGSVLSDARDILTKIGGVLVIILGLHTIEVFQIPFLAYDTRRQQPPDPRLGYASSVLMGVFFSAGWSPCIGPVMGAIMTLALDASDPARGAFLLLAYSLGMGVPFLLFAAGMGQATEVLRKYRKYMRYMSIVAGVLLIVIGLLLITDTMKFMANITAVRELQKSLDAGVVGFWAWVTGGS
jgi:cytochrome c-type biogenesis protein